MSDIYVDKYIIFGREGCQWCEKAKQFLTENGEAWDYIDIRASEENMAAFRRYFPFAQTVPQIMLHQLLDDTKIGGYTDLKDWYGRSESSPV